MHLFHPRRCLYKCTCGEVITNTLLQLRHALSCKVPLSQFIHCPRTAQRFPEMPTCPSDNQQAVDQTDFWTDGGIDWDAHRIGWAIAGACAAAVRPFILVSLVSYYRILPIDCHNIYLLSPSTLSVSSIAVSEPTPS